MRFAHLLEAVNHTVIRLNETHEGYSDHQFLRVMSQFLTDVHNAVVQAEEENVIFGRRILSWSAWTPDKITGTLALAINSVTTNVEFKNHLLQVNAGLSRSAANASKACDNMAILLNSNLRPAYRDVEHIKDKLSNLSKVIPSIRSENRDLGPAMKFLENNSNSLLSMAYTNHLALKESSELVIRQTAPIIFQRLHCNFTGAGARAGLGLAAAAAVAAAWLAL